MKRKQHTTALERRKRRVRAKVRGTAERPRLSVTRSLKHITAQLIDDDCAYALACVKDGTKNKITKGTKTKRAEKVGESIAKEAKKLGIKVVVFDRGGRKFHGRVKALAEGAKKQGLKL